MPPRSCGGVSIHCYLKLNPILTAVCARRHRVPLWSDRNCPGHNLTDVSVRLPEGNAAVVRHPPRQHTLLCQLLSFRVPAEHCCNDFVLFISAAGDEQLVVARRNATAGPLVGELSHQAPCVLLGAVGVEGFHCPTWKGNGHWFALAVPVRDLIKPSTSTKLCSLYL